MAGTNQPAPLGGARAAASRGATAGMAAGHGRPVSIPMHGGSVGARGGGGASTGLNPISRGVQEDTGSEYVPVQDVPIHSLGTALLSMALHPMQVDRANEEQARRHDAIEAERARNGAAYEQGLNAYQNALASNPSNPNAAWLQFLQSPDGHAAFTNPPVFNAALQVHSAALGALPGQPPQVQPLGNGLFWAHDPNGGGGRLLTPKDMGAGSNAGAMTPHKVGEQWVTADPNKPGNFMPATIGGQPVPPQYEKLSVQDKAEVEGLQRVMPALDQMRQASSVAGAFGATGLATAIGYYTPWDTPQARQLGNSLDQAHASIAASRTGSVRLSHAYNDMQNELPGKFASEPEFNDKTASAYLVGRNALSNLDREFAAQRSDTSMLDPMIQRYRAYPAQMDWLNNSLAKLRTDPTSVSNDDIAHLYAEETFLPNQKFQLPSADAKNVMGEVDRRNLWNVRDDALKTHPELKYLPDANVYRGWYGQDLAQHAQQYGPYVPPQQPATPDQAVQQQQQAPLAQSMQAAQPTNQAPAATNTTPGTLTPPRDLGGNQPSGF